MLPTERRRSRDRLQSTSAGTKGIQKEETHTLSKTTQTDKWVHGYDLVMKTHHHSQATAMILKKVIIHFEWT